MAVTIDPLTDGDFTRINRADATTGWTLSGSPWSMIALNTASQVENTGCIEAGKVDTGLGSSSANFTSRSLENVHLRMWGKLAQQISTLATYGARLISGTETNHGSWSVYGADRQVVVYNGWMMLVTDPRKPYAATVGTAPSDILAVTDAGIRMDFTDANGKALAVHDMLWEGNEVSVEGGTTGARGTFAEWASDDFTNGYGILRDVGGVYYLNAGAVFQGVGTATSYFEDTNQLIIFEDLPVSGSLYKLRHVGNGTGINSFQVGTTSGTGVDQEGAGGGVIRAAGDAPFRIEAINADVDAVNYYGVTMLGPSAAYADQFRNVKVEDNGTGFTDISSNATGPNLAAVNLMPATQALNDATYFGHDERFYALNLNLGTAKGGTWTGTWEYYNGTAWASLTDVTDGTANYATTGAQAVTFAIPDDWAANAIDSDTRYWVRFRISSFTSSGTNPQHAAAGCTCDMAGDIRLEDPNVDMVGCTLSGMGSIRLRNGAFLKKTVVDSTNASAKHAAIDLGNADPTADTFRDVTVQNCSKGILLKGTSTGTTTYNFRNIAFTGNTNDVRVDFPAGATIVINILENGDSPSIDNVNGSTVTVNNSVTLELTGIETDSEVRIVNLDDTTNFNKELTGSEQISGSVTKVTIADGGTGYAVNDVLTVVGGTGTAATITVDAISSGVVTAVSITTGGSYTANPANPVATTVAPAGGTGCTLRLTIGGTFSYVYDSSFNPNVAIIVFHLNFREVRIEQALQATSQSIPIQQNVDRTYNNP